MKHGTNATMNHDDMTRALRAALALAAFALAAALALAGCKSNALGDQDRSGTGTGSLSIAIADTASSRLVMPSLPTAASVAGYEITLSREGYATRTTGRIADLATFTMQALETGAWNLALAGFDASGTKIAEGSATVTIETDKTVTATVVLGPAFARTAGGTGTVSLVFACSGFLANSNDWRVAFTPSAGGTTLNYARDTTSVVTVDPVANTATFTATLASGDWDMVFSVKVGSTEYVTATDVVKVYDGRTSTTSTGAAIAISVADLARADRVFYVSNTTTAGNSGRDRAHACTLDEAIIILNGRSDLTEAEPGVVILTENVVFPVSGDPADFIYIRRPIKIKSLDSAPSPFTLTDSASGLNTLIQVNHQSPSNTGSLTLERVVVQPGGAWGYEFGVVQVTSTVSPGTLTLNNGAVIRGNQSGQMAGGVFLISGRLVMNEGSEISGNKADYGGGVVMSSSGDEFVMNGGTITGNTAKYSGGGVYAGNAGAKVSLNGGSITGNVVKDSGTGDFGPGAGVCLFGETAGSLSCSVSGGWKSVVSGNTGVGPELVRQLQVGEPLQLKSAIESAHADPVWVDVSFAFTVPNVVASAALYDNNQVVIFSASGSSFTASSRSTPLITVPSTSTLWFDTEIVGDNSATAPLINVTGGTLILDSRCSIGKNGNTLTNLSGGAIYASAGSVEMRDGEIKECSAKSGGAIYLGSTATFAMTGGTVSYNNAQYGGAIFLAQQTKMSMSGTSVITKNQAQNYAGGICAMDTAKLEITGSAPQIVDNNGGTGGRGGNGVYLGSQTVTFTVSGASWPDVVRNNAPAELPSVVRAWYPSSTEDLRSILQNPAVPAWVSIADYTLDVGSTLEVSGVAILNGSSTVIRRATNAGPVFDVLSTGNLALNGSITVDGMNGTYSNVMYPLINVRQSGSFVMRSSAVKLIKASAGLIPGAAVSVAGTFTLADGTIGGSSPEMNSTNDNGGGVYVDGTGDMTMSGGLIGYNSALENGGGVYVAVGGKFVQTGGVVTHNTALQTGGGITVAGNGVSGGEYTFSDGDISYNTLAPGGKGGGIAVANGGTMTYSHGTIDSNAIGMGSGSAGGGIYLEGTLKISDPVGVGASITANSGSSGGGGLHIGPSGRVDLWVSPTWTQVTAANAYESGTVLFRDMFTASNSPNNFTFE